MFKPRRAAPTDLEALVELCAEHAAFEEAKYEKTGKLEALKTAIFSASPRLYVWVIEDAGQLVGFASLTLDYSTWDAAEFAHLDCLYLKTEYRAKGLGQALFSAALEFARQRGCINLQWQTPTWNKAAIGFYNRQGAGSKSKQRFVLPIETREKTT